MPQNVTGVSNFTGDNQEGSESSHASTFLTHKKAYNNAHFKATKLFHGRGNREGNYSSVNIVRRSHLSHKCHKCTYPLSAQSLFDSHK